MQRPHAIALRRSVLAVLAASFTFTHHCALAQAL